MRHLWVAVPAALTLIVSSTPAEFQLDLWQHLSCGRQIVEAGRLIHADAFSHTVAGREVVNQNWLGQALFFQAYRVGGIELLTFLAACMYAAAIACTTYLCWLRSGHCRIAAACTLLAVGLSVENLGTRPQAFSGLFFAVELLVLWGPVRARWKPIAASGIVVVWANCHGAFVLGVMLPWLFLVGRLASIAAMGGRRYAHMDPLARSHAASAALATAAAFCNPDPAHTISNLSQSVTNALQRNFQEWQAPSLQSITGAGFFFSIAMAMIALNCSRRRLDATEILLVAVFLFLGGKACRMATWWGLVLAPLLAGHLATMFLSEGTGAPQKRGVLAMNCLMTACLLVAVIGSLPWTKQYNPILHSARRAGRPPNEPYALCEFLKTRGDIGNVFNPMEWGGYLIWHEAGRLKVFADGRVDPFPPEVWQEYLDIAEGRQGWEELLARYRVGTIIASFEMTPRLVQYARRSPRWSEVYSDSLSVVFERAPHPTSSSPN